MATLWFYYKEIGRAVTFIVSCTIEWNENKKYARKRTYIMCFGCGWNNTSSVTHEIYLLHYYSFS